MSRREMRVIRTGRVIGAVEFDGDALTLVDQASDVLGFIREKVGDDRAFGRDLMDNGWMNMAIELGPRVD